MSDLTIDKTYNSINIAVKPRKKVNMKDVIWTFVDKIFNLSNLMDNLVMSFYE